MTHRADEPRIRKWTWYIEPEGSYTNMVVSQIIPDELCHEGKLCADGAKRNLWECRNYSDLSRLVRERQELGIRFNIFVQEGRGAIKRWRFTSRVRRTVSAR